jgi:hypothetical protein
VAVEPGFGDQNAARHDNLRLPPLEMAPGHRPRPG